MLILTIGEQKGAQVDVRVMEQVIIALGLESKKVHSDGLQIVFWVTIGLLVLEVVLLTFRVSFFTMLGVGFVLYILFLGYHTDRSVVHVIGYFIVSVFFDLGYVFLNMSTTMILNPIIYTQNTFMKFIAMGLLVLSAILRVILVIKLVKYK